MSVEPNMLGEYGLWAAELTGERPGHLSFLNPQWQEVDEWRAAARKRFAELLLRPAEPAVPEVREVSGLRRDGLDIELIKWRLPYGPATEAVFLKPAGASGPLPAVLALHDHGAVKFFGWEKIAAVEAEPHPLMAEHQRQYYGGRPWANELAKRGYAVLAHDLFAFGSRRIRPSDVAAEARSDIGFAELAQVSRDDEAEISQYNAFAAQHEHIVAKSLFCAGLTWPGVMTYEDQCALSYLCSRPEVDSERVGCAGLSGGGLRTVYLAGLDERIAAACCVGMMTTWRDFLLHKSWTHTWMIYVPGLPRELDYCEVLGLMAPKPVLVLNNQQDELFTIEEMCRADRILRDVYYKAGASERYECIFYPGPHKFDLEMQEAAFQFFDRHLR